MDERDTAPSAERNKGPILEVARRVLPARGLVLEIGSGTGQHVAHFATALPSLGFQPSELDTARHPSIRAWTRELENVRPPIELDVTRLPWPIEAADAIICINVIHISPWRTTLALMEGAAGLLPSGGVLVTYGPYRRGGRHTAPSNEEFDTSLKSRNPEWGVRDMEEVQAAADRAGLRLDEAVAMPANNFTLVFRR
jgi:SAM-dependent methyltransferase